MARIYNFSAGPAVLPLEVLKEVQAELLDFQETGMSILEMSHRSPAYEKVNAEVNFDPCKNQYCRFCDATKELCQYASK